MRVGAVNVFKDIEGGIKLATNKHASRGTNHIDVKHHRVRDASHARKVRVAHVRSEYQHADVLKKPLRMKTFLQAREVCPKCSVICLRFRGYTGKRCA